MPDTITSLMDTTSAFEGFSRAQVSMILTNPNLEDNPIVYVNDAFTRDRLLQNRSHREELPVSAG